MFEMEEAISSIPHLIEGLSVTIQVTLLVVFFATVIGVILGVFITYGSKYIKYIIRIFTDFVRGIPVLVLIFFCRTQIRKKPQAENRRVKVQVS